MRLYPHRYRQFAGPTSIAPTLGAMGYSRRRPCPPSSNIRSARWCYAGDGCFQMNMQELGVASSTAWASWCWCSTTAWGTIRAHQEREFPGRPIALGFENPDFAQIARGYRGYGEIVTRTEVRRRLRARAGLCRARTPARAADIRYDADGIAPGQTLSAIRDAAPGALAALHS